MSRAWLSIHSILSFALLAGCQSPSPEPTKKASEPAQKPDQPVAPKPEPAPTPPTKIDPAEPTETISEPPPRGPAPAWFSPDAFEHVAIIRQDTQGTKVPSGESSAMIVLELPASTTPEQCIEQFKKKLAETVKEPPIEAVMPQGHLSLRGETDTYAYTVVCGIAKEKPTMFLSFIH